MGSLAFADTVVLGEVSWELEGWFLCRSVEVLLVLVMTVVLVRGALGGGEDIGVLSDFTPKDVLAWKGLDGFCFFACGMSTQHK